MPIQMIGRKIGYDGTRGRLLHGLKLEAGKLDDGIVVFAHLLNMRKKRLTDIATQIHAPAPLFLKLAGEDLGAKGGGRRLAVAARDADNGGRRQRKEDLSSRGSYRSR